MNIKKFGWICLGLTVLINIILFPFLPQNLVVQISLTGEATRVVSKPLALLLLPGILLLINLIYGNDDTKSSRVVFASVIIFAINIVINVVNLVVFK